MQYKIYALALPFDLRCESGTLPNMVIVRIQVARETTWDGGWGCVCDLLQNSVDGLVQIRNLGPIVLSEAGAPEPQQLW